MTTRAAEVLREARRTSRLTQAELAERAGTTQSVISAYECGHRQPTLPMLHRLIAATGGELVIDVRSGATSRPSQQVRAHRADILAAAGRHGLTNVRLFGSVARGDDTANSDVDLLVDLPDSATLWSVAAAADEIGDLLGVRVDLVTPSDLKVELRERVLAEAVLL